MPRRASRATWRFAFTPRACLAAIPSSFCTAAATPRSRCGSRDLAGEETDVLCVKGTGADMAAIEPAGHAGGAARRPAASCARTTTSPTTEMVRLLRANLIDPGAPNPSVETLLHAFMPHKFVDHTHATALLSLIDQPDGERACARHLRREARHRALSAAGLRSRQGCRRHVRRRSEGGGPDPAQARHLHLRRRRARSLRDA